MVQPPRDDFYRPALKPEPSSAFDWKILLALAVAGYCFYPLLVKPGKPAEDSAPIPGQTAFVFFKGASRPGGSGEVRALFESQLSPDAIELREGEKVPDTDWTVAKITLEPTTVQLESAKGQLMVLQIGDKVITLAKIPPAPLPSPSRHGGK